METHRSHDPASWIGPRLSAWLLRHGVAVILIGLVVLSVPAYLAAMEVQLLNNDLIAALCGFIGIEPPGR